MEDPVTYLVMTTPLTAHDAKRLLRLGSITTRDDVLWIERMACQGMSFGVILDALKHRPHDP